MIANITVNSNYTTLLSAGAGVRLANVGMYFCNNSNQTNVISIYGLSADAQPSKSNVLAYNVSVSPSETFYFGQEKFILDEGERLVAKTGMGSMGATMTFMSIGSSEYSSNAKATATLNGGGVGAVVVTSPGAGYTSPPTVTFTGCDGQDATATVTLTDSGQIHEVVITNAGSGYICPPAVVLSGGNNPVIEGCTDANATNYNHLATIDNGSCEYPPASQIVRESDIKCWWKFDETSGTTATDSVGGIVANLSNMSDSNWVVGKRNNSLSFDGLGLTGGSNAGNSGSYLTVDSGRSELDFGTGPFSISLWLKPISVHSWGRVLMASQSFATSNGNWRLRNNSANEIDVDFTNGASGAGWARMTWVGKDLLDGGWHHFCLVRNGSNVKGYLDGDKAPQEIINLDYSVNDGQESGIFIGASLNSSAAKMEGLIDDVRIYNIALSEAEVTLIKNGDWV